MHVIKIDQKKWAAGIEKLKSAYQLFGPRQIDGQYEFQILAESELPDLSGQNTHLSPKALVYPQSHVMFAYTLDETKDDHHIMQEVLPDDAPRAVIGIRPCDAASFLLVKRNFDTPQHQDPYWLKAYEAFTFVGHGCVSPCGTCFCTTAGSGPFDETGLDVIFTEAQDGFLLKALTEKGSAFLKAAGWDAEENQVSDSADTFSAAQAAAEEKITAKIDSTLLKEKDALELYDAPFWEDVAFACINCGTCTYVCPTCWCFDIQDENCGDNGIRMRNWDSCMFPLFTLHGSGHNPRGQKVARVRQRFMHKLKYYVDKYGNGIQCVGCGRCIRLCPVNIDIRDACERMNSF